MTLSRGPGAETSRGRGVKPALGEITRWPLFVHVAAATVLTWIAGYLRLDPFFVCTWVVLVIWLVESRQRQNYNVQTRFNLRREMQMHLPITDEETVKWLNSALESAWPEFVERLTSLYILPKMVPWFLNSYKPSAVSKLALKSVNLGSIPPLVTGVRVYQEARDGDHLAMEMNVEVVCGKDMFMEVVANVGHSSWAGFGLIPWTAYITDVQLIGKVRIGVRFQHTFPFVDRVSVSFITEPQVSLGCRVLGRKVGGGFDAAGLPLVAGFVDATIKNALKTSLMAPNMLVIDDIVALLGDIVPPPGVGPVPGSPPQQGPGMPAAPLHSKAKAGLKGVQGGDPVAFLLLEILRADNLRAADRRGSSDPYVKGSVDVVKFQTSIKKSTLTPSWMEDFRVPIYHWNEPTVLRLRVVDYDKYSAADELGICEVNLNRFRDQQRHELVANLQEARTGRIQIAFTILENMDARPDGVQADVPLSEQTNAMAGAPPDQGSVDRAMAGAESRGLKRRVVRLGNTPSPVCPGVSIYTWDDVTLGTEPEVHK
eukprot:SM000042S15384  [mRNA]  locus=s42:679825:684315:- [translate_table: standard]